MTQLHDRPMMVADDTPDVEAQLRPGEVWLNRILMGVLGALVVALGALAVLWPLPIGDLWWQLKTGELIVQTGRIPHTDLFSHTAAGNAWVVQGWLTAVLLHLLNARLGPEGLLYFKMAIAGGAFGLVLWRCWARTGQALVSVAFTALAIYASRAWIDLQTGTINLLFLALLLLALDQWRLGYWRGAAWGIPALIAVWANCDSGFVLGLVIVLVELLGAGGEALALTGVQATKRRVGVGVGVGVGGNGPFPTPTPTPTPTRSFPERPLWQMLARVLGISLVAGLLTPNHIYGYLAAPVTFLTRGLMLKTLATWPSANFHEAGSRPLELLLIAAVLGWHVSTRPRRAADVLMTMGLVLAALYSTRHIPLFAIACAPIIAEQVGGLAALGRQKAKGKRQKAKGRDPAGFLDSSRSDPTLLPFAFCLLPFAFAAALLALVRLEWRRLPALPVQRWVLACTQPDSFPNAAVEFLRQNPGSGNLFNDAGWGSYCLSRLSPAQKVFIDDRAELYANNSALEEYPAILNASRPDWLDLLATHAIDTVLVRPEAPMAGVLAQTAGWRVIYQDPQAVVLRKVQG